MTLQILSTTRKLGLMTLEKKQSLPKRVTTSMEYILFLIMLNWLEKARQFGKISKVRDFI